MTPKWLQNRSPEPPQTLFEPGLRRKLLSDTFLGLNSIQKCLVLVSSSVLSLAPLALVFRFAVVSRFRRDLVLKLSSFSLRAKRRTSENCNTLYAKTHFSRCVFTPPPSERRTKTQTGVRKTREIQALFFIGFALFEAPQASLAKVSVRSHPEAPN